MNNRAEVLENLGNIICFTRNSGAEISLHDIVKIRRRSQPKKFEATKSSTGNTFYTMRFCFESEDGTRFYINCFADEKESLKIWGDKDL